MSYVSDKVDKFTKTVVGLKVANVFCVFDSSPVYTILETIKIMKSY